MPMWVCPFCSAQMNVQENLIGQIQPCYRCAKESPVIDIDDVSAAPAVVMPGNRWPVETPAAQALSNGDPTDFASDNVSRRANQLFAVGIVACLAAGIAIWSTTQQPLLGYQLLGLAGVLTVQWTLAYPFYVQANDTRVNRRLLEKLVDLQRK